MARMRVPFDPRTQPIGIGPQDFRGQAQFALDQDALRTAQAGRVKESRLSALRPIALGSSPYAEDARRQVAGISMEEGKAIQDFRMAASKEEQDVFDRGVDLIGKVSSGLLAAPPEERPALYAQAHQFLDRAGVDVSMYPEEYTDEMIPVLENARNSASEIDRTSFVDVMDKDGNIIGKRNQATNELSFFTPPTGMNITFDRETGNWEYTQGPGAGGKTASNQGALTTSAQGKVQTELQQVVGQLDRIELITQGFRPEFLTLAKKWGSSFDAGLEKAGVDIGPEARKQLVEYTTFRNNALSNLNEEIKRITGAQMSELEAERIRAALPDPGSGWFDGDSASQFKGNLDATRKWLKLVAYRKFWTLQKGITFSSIPLGSMEMFIRNREEELYAQKLTEEQVQATMQAEFGI